jgi:NAD(P)H-flavin reductase
VSALTGVVRSNRRATPTTRLLTIDPQGQAFEFRAGQWANLGRSAAAAKPFSIASPPGQETLEFLIREDGSGLELTPARKGTPVYIEGPHGRFTLADDISGATDVLFIAGGTGIAPIRSMLMETVRRGHGCRRALIYSARSGQELAFLPEWRKAARDGLISLSLVVTRHVPSRWKGLSGRLSAAILQSLVGHEKPQAFVCGPEGFVKDVTAALHELGVERVRTEEQ